MTTGNYRPPVLMIRIKGHELSEEFAEISRKSWEAQGFEVRYFDAVTPETMDDQSFKLRFAEKLLLRPNELKRHEEAKEKGFEFKGVFSETEKAVWYSHLQVWRHVAYTTKEETIIAEHDARLNHMDWDCENHAYYSLTRNILGAQFFHHHVLKRFLGEFFKPDVPVVRMNPDAYMFDWMKKYTLGEKGRKVRTKSHFVINYSKIPKGEWPVRADWAHTSTIEHRKFYDGENDEYINWRSH